MSRMKRDGHRGRDFKIRAVFVGVLIVALLAAGYVLGRKWELSQYQEQRGQMSSGFGQIPTIEVEGVTYEQKMNLTTVLLIGTDRRSDEVSEGYRDGGQADFLLLTVVDHDAKTIRQLQIDRDTIVPVSVLLPTIISMEMLFDAVSSPGVMVLSVFSTLWYIVCPRP